MVRAAGDGDTADGEGGECTLDTYAPDERPTVVRQWPVLRAPAGERVAAARLEREVACVVSRGGGVGGGAGTGAGAGDLVATVGVDGVRVCAGGDCCTVEGRKAGDAVEQVRRSASAEGKVYVSVVSTARCVLA